MIGQLTAFLSGSLIICKFILIHTLIRQIPHLIKGQLAVLPAYHHAFGDRKDTVEATRRTADQMIQRPERIVSFHLSACEL